MRRSAVFLTLAMVAAFLAAVVVFSALRTRDRQMRKEVARQVSIVVAAKEIPIGAKITPSMVKMVRWSADSVPKGSVRSLEAVRNSYSLTEIFAGEPILSQVIVTDKGIDAIMPLMIPRGMRAMSVPVDEVSDIAGFVQPHTRVDVVIAFTGSGSGQKAFAKIILQDVRVLAVAQEINPRGSGAKVVKVVTLLVRPRQAEELALASREGTLRLVMRGYDDTKIADTSAVDMADLVGRAPMDPIMSAQTAGSVSSGARQRARYPAYSVEIMRDGRRSQSVSFIRGELRAFSETPRRSAVAAGRRATVASIGHTAGGNAANAEVPGAEAGYMPQVKAIQIP